jgi:hypothetical protein
VNFHTPMSQAHTSLIKDIPSWIDWLSNGGESFKGRFDMLKKLATRLFGGGPSERSEKGFFLIIRCSVCGEEFNLFINKSTDLSQNFDEQGGVTYSLNKEIIGGRCRNLIHVRMEFDGARNLVSREIENGEFIDGD